MVEAVLVGSSVLRHDIVAGEARANRDSRAEVASRTPDARATRALSPVRPKPDPRLVLVVDDARDAREMYASYLEHVGLRVVTARDGIEAVEKAKFLKPDAIVMDLMMPVLDGWEATRRIKANPDTSSIPIIALTGLMSLATPEQALLAGCNAFVTKPCLPDELHRILRRVLDRTH